LLSQVGGLHTSLSRATEDSAFPTVQNHGRKPQKGANHLQTRILQLLL
jgi:hypothetical protein